MTTNQFNTITLTEDHRGVACLRLCRAEKHNALNQKMIQELSIAALNISKSESIRVVILEAEGRSFCAGADLKWMQAQFDANAEEQQIQAEALSKMLSALDKLPKPMIAKVQGPAYGGGLGLLSVCDTVIASSAAKFAFTETKIGLIPATIAPFVIRRLGEAAARNVFMNAKLFDAQDAYRWGMINAVVACNDLNCAVQREVEHYLHCAPGAVAAAKALCQSVARESSSTPQNLSEALVKRWQSAEGRQGIKAFFDKTAPPWKTE